ncbi:MAG: hypothetical protein U5M51_06765 [Emticicia sp.]|nr:hypothetical protein [Emticicia sp.]
MWDWFSIDWLSWQTLRSFVWAEKLYLYAIIGIPFLFLFRWLFYTRGQQKTGAFAYELSASHSLD